MNKNVQSQLQTEMLLWQERGGCNSLSALSSLGMIVFEDAQHEIANKET